MSAAPVPVSVGTRHGELEYVDLGAGPAVLAIHGAMGGWDQSLILARAVGPAGHRTIAVSRPGYLGTPLDGGAAPEQQADSYCDLLDQLGVAQAASIAISGGGPSAIQFAIRHPQRCRALVLISTVAGPTGAGVPLSFRLFMALARRPWFAARMRRRAGRARAISRRAIRDPERRARALADPEVAAWFGDLRASVADRLALRLAGTKNDFLVTGTRTYPLEEIRVPTLVVHGARDRVVPFAHGARLAARIPGAHFLPLDDGEHYCVFTHRGAIQGRVAAFLAGLAPPR
jgi:pimeloyl-ACP methyl ester carboxylesterase